MIPLKARSLAREHFIASLFEILVDEKELTDSLRSIVDIKGKDLQELVTQTANRLTQMAPQKEALLAQVSANHNRGLSYSSVFLREPFKREWLVARSYQFC